MKIRIIFLLSLTLKLSYSLWELWTSWDNYLHGEKNKGKFFKNSFFLSFSLSFHAPFLLLPSFYFLVSFFFSFSSSYLKHKDTKKYGQDVCSKVDEPTDCHAERSKSGRERQMSYDMISHLHVESKRKWYKWTYL